MSLFVNRQQAGRRFVRQIRYWRRINEDVAGYRLKPSVQRKCDIFLAGDAARDINKAKVTRPVVALYLLITYCNCKTKVVMVFVYNNLKHRYVLNDRIYFVCGKFTVLMLLWCEQKSGVGGP